MMLSEPRVSLATQWDRLVKALPRELRFASELLVVPIPTSFLFSFWENFVMRNEIPPSNIHRAIRRTADKLSIGKELNPASLTTLIHEAVLILIPLSHACIVRK